ncbi:hypothetical protein ZIOFF_034484 [Zingiber officinale]|uniref:Uncharacterized protein n=1 Tax=Zingiber officinale TaxID=94328 RepID=A0A8J5L7U2_ZINOF|nr:hypothetical protein ZIOFF_034484 [Zingiber officinale]
MSSLEYMPIVTESRCKSPQQMLSAAESGCNMIQRMDLITYQMKYRFVENEVPREITNNIKGVIKGVWPTRKKVLNDIKDLLWENFKLRYNWDNFTDREMKKVWNENSSERYRVSIHLAKKAALSSAQEDLGRKPDILDMIGIGSDWMEANIWSDLVKIHWNKEDHKIKSKIARKNKMTTKDGSTTKHTGGSISFGAHRKRMKRDLGRDVEFEVLNECIKESKVLESLWITNRLELVRHLQAKLSSSLVNVVAGGYCCYEPPTIALYITVEEEMETINSARCYSAMRANDVALACPAIGDASLTPQITDDGAVFPLHSTQLRWDIHPESVDGRHHLSSPRDDARATFLVFFDVIAALSVIAGRWSAPFCCRETTL